MFSQDVKGGKCIVDSRYCRTQLLQLRCPTKGESASQVRIRCCPDRQSHRSVVGGQPVNVPAPRFAATEVPSAPCPNATRSAWTSNVCRIRPDPAAGHDVNEYPTAARVQYILGCMVVNGQTRRPGCDCDRKRNYLAFLFADTPQRR